MSIQGNKFTEIADAIRAKKGTSNPIKASDFAAEIASIETGGETLGGEYNIEQIVDGDNCELVVTTAEQPENKLAQVVDGTATEITADDLAGATNIRNYAFYYASLQFITIPNSVTSIGNGAFSGCSNLTSITIPNSVTSIGNSAFHSCKGLTGSFTIPDSVTSIGSTAFTYCTNLTSVMIGNSVTGIGTQTFAYCTNLTSVTIGNSVTSIGSGAFYGPNKLTSITIPNSVKTIESAAFYSCIKLTEMTILATTPPTLADTNAIPSNVTTIYVPAGALSAYQSATNWSSFASKFIEMEA